MNKQPNDLPLKLKPQQLVPRIKGMGFLNAMDVASVPEEQRPLTEPLAGELLITYAFETDTSFVMATPALLAEAGISLETVSRTARINLTKGFPSPQYFVRQGCAVAVTGRDLEATMLLVDRPWRQIEGNFTGDIVAAVPRRNRILIADSADQHALAAMREAVEEFYSEKDDSHALSKQLMRRQRGQWELFNAS